MTGTARAAAGVLGELMVTAGLVLLLFCGYELEVTSLYTDRQQASLGAALDRQWAEPDPAASAGPAESAGPAASARPAATGTPASAAPAPGKAPVRTATSVRPAPPPLGAGLARLWVPRFGSSYRRVVVEGVGTEDLKKGPGHYPGTALPGQVGNMVVSGHRTTYGQPFHRIAELHPGDALVMETRISWFTYRVTGSRVVAPTAVDVLDPVPGQPGVRATDRLLTLTSCHPEYSARQRWITSARLQSQLAKGPGVRPPALSGG